MRKIFILMSVIILCLPSQAQEKTKKGEAKPYATNSGFFDNSWIGIGGGVNLMTGDYDVSHEYDDFTKGKTTNFGTHNITPSIDVFFGKWWTPVVGMRLAYHGYSLNGYTMDTNGAFVSQDWDMYCGHIREKMNYNSGRVDVMLNLCNAIQGYRENRFWDVIPYLGFGAANLNGKNVRTDTRTDVWSFMGDAGILNTLRLCKRWAITLDVRCLFSDDKFDMAAEQANHKIDAVFTASAGIAVRLGTVGFRHSFTPDYSSYEDLIAQYKKDLDAINTALDTRLALMESLKKDVESSEALNAELRNTSKVKSSALIVYFALNSAELDSKELAILDAYMKGIDKKCTLTVHATADSKTGSKSWNRRLSEKRAAYLSGLLENKYGITPNCQTIDEKSDQHTSPVLNRAGVINVSFE